MNERNENIVTVYRDNQQEWRWHRVAPNGEVISDSGEGYAYQRDAVNMAASLNSDCHIKVIDE